jgi:dTDP-4-dehydrorhamnose reductase
MKVLVLGGDGMLGHQLVESLDIRHEVIGTFHKKADIYRDITPYLPRKSIYGVDARDFPSVAAVIATIKPDAVINAIGIVKQRAASKDAIVSLEVNSLLPHHLAVACGKSGARLVHLSTDCVFSGSKGMYGETDFADADDLYGRTKFLGEVSDAGSITLRTSIIGLELSRKKSLIEWFLAQQGPIEGFRKAIYTGFTTLEMARIIESVLVDHPDKSGVYHLSSDPIDKYSLLCKLRDRLGRPVEIIPDDDFSCDRSMLSTRFRSEFCYTPPSWDVMIEELATQIEARYS